MSRIALVTGASKGVGRGIAYGLAGNGWDVAINYCNDEAGAQETADQVKKKGRRSWILKADVGYKDQVEEMFNRLLTEAGQLDLLVNNSGVQTWCPLLELSEEDWDRTLRTNLKGTFLCTQQAAKVMKGRGGCIINIGSGCSKVPFPNLVDYTASKGGINNFTMVLLLSWGRTISASIRWLPAQLKLKGPAWRVPITRTRGGRLRQCAGSVTWRT